MKNFIKMKKPLSFIIILILILLGSIQIAGAEMFGNNRNYITHDELIINGKTIPGVKEIYSGFNISHFHNHKKGFIEYKDEQDKKSLINLKGELIAKGGDYKLISYYNSINYTLIYKKNGENQYSVYNSFLGKDILTLPVLPTDTYVPENGENPYFLYSINGKSIINLNGKEFVLPKSSIQGKVFSKDYKKFAIITYDKSTNNEKLYINGKFIKSFKKQKNRFLSTAFSRDGKYYVLFRHYFEYGKETDDIIGIYKTDDYKKVNSTKLTDYNFSFLKLYCKGLDKKTCKDGKIVLNKNGKEVLHMDKGKVYVYTKDFRRNSYYNRDVIGLNKIIFNPYKYIYGYLDKDGVNIHLNVNGEFSLLSKYNLTSLTNKGVNIMTEKDFKYYYGVYEKDGKYILNLNGREVEKVNKKLKPRFYISKNNKHYGYIYEKNNKFFLNIDGNKTINIPNRNGLMLKIGNNGRYYYTYRIEEQKGKKDLEVLNLNGEYETHISCPNIIYNVVVSEDIRNFIIECAFSNFNINGHDILNTKDYPSKDIAPDLSAYTYGKTYSGPLKYVTVDLSKYPLNKKNSSITFPQKIKQIKKEPTISTSMKKNIDTILDTKVFNKYNKEKLDNIYKILKNLDTSKIANNKQKLAIINYLKESFEKKYKTKFGK